MSDVAVTLGILGGSGLYELAGLDEVEEREVDTPFGPPSDALLIGRLEGRRVVFLARHGRQHRLLPGEINYRANIFAMKVLGVERILSASAVGSMRDEIRPRDVVLVDQFVDRTQCRPSTFFGDGVAAHVGLADPICPELRSIVLAAARHHVRQAHDRGTYVCIEGPAFSTRAESELYRSWDVSVIGMTNLQEAKLCREAEICYVTLALVTDYDCWHEEEQDVSVSSVLENLQANAGSAAEIVRQTARSLPEGRNACKCGEALRHALISPRDAIPEPTRRRLGPILAKYLA